MKQVVIVGAGLAGLAAAVRLADEGHAVTLVERGRVPGGRVRRVPAPGGGDLIDWGQHLLLGAYHETLAFCDHLGTRDRLAPVRGVTPFVSGTGKVHPYRAGGLPGPLHALPGLLALTQLSFRDRLRIAAPALDAKRGSARRLQDLDALTAEKWLRGLGQRDAALRLFWEPVALATLNTPLAEASAGLLATVLAKGVLGRAADAAPLLPRTTLHDLLVGPACDRMKARGGQMLLSSGVKGLVFDGHRTTGVILDGGERVPADAVILALPPWALAPLVEDGTPLEDLRPGIQGFVPSEIVSLELWFDRAWLPYPYAGLLEAVPQWVFRHPPDKLGRHRVSVVISAADVSRDGLREHVQAELKRFFPAAASAQVMDQMTIREPRATFRAVPNLSALRPGPKTRSPNVFLAGDWCDTGLPATIEGAVLSGGRAAAAMAPERPFVGNRP